MGIEKRLTKIQNGLFNAKRKNQWGFEKLAPYDPHKNGKKKEEPVGSLREQKFDAFDANLELQSLAFFLESLSQISPELVSFFIVEFNKLTKRAIVGLTLVNVIWELNHIYGLGYEVDRLKRLQEIATKFFDILVDEVVRF